MGLKIFSSQVEKPPFGSPSDIPKCEFLKKSEYLGEFKTEAEKARVRYNLGLPSDYALNWGNIRGNILNQLDLMNLLDVNLNGINLKLNSFNGTLSAISSKVAKLEDLLNNNGESLNIKDIYSLILSLKINVALNSTDISSLITGGDTSINLLVNKNANDITLILSRVLSLENRPTVDSSLVNRVVALEAAINSGSSYDDTLIRTELSNLSSRLEALQREVGSNTLTDLSVSKNLWEVTPAADDIPIKVIASYSLMKDRDVTESCEVVSSDRNIITWNSATKKIQINNEIESNSTAYITFTYGELSVVVTVNVRVQPILQYKQYVGLASDSSLIFENINFQCDTVGRIWDSSIPVMSTGLTWNYIYIITTLDIKSISEVGPYNLSEIYEKQLTSSTGITYKVYKIGPIRSVEGLNLNVTLN